MASAIYNTDSLRDMPDLAAEVLALPLYPLDSSICRYTRNGKIWFMIGYVCFPDDTRICRHR